MFSKNTFYFYAIFTSLFDSMFLENIDMAKLMLGPWTELGPNGEYGLITIQTEYFTDFIIVKQNWHKSLKVGISLLMWIMSA